MGTNKSELIDRAKSILDKSFNQETFKKIISIKNKLSDAVHIQIGTNADTLRDYKYKSNKIPEGFIMSSFGHFIADPFDNERREMILTCYNFVDNATTTVSHGNNHPNLNESASLDFLNCLVRTSKNEYKLWQDSSYNKRDVLLLKGNRGIGKTCFINYFFTKYNNELLDKKIIWIRLNVANQIYGLKPNLERLFITKLVYLLYRFYSGNEKIKSIIDIVKNEIDQIDQIELKVACLENLYNLEKQFIKLEYHSPITEDTVKELISRKFIATLLKNNFSFIFILDGFDKIKNSMRFKDKFYHLRKEIQKIFSLQTRLGACYLLVTRSETIKYLEGSGNFQAHSTTIPNIKNYEIEVIPFEHIFLSRKKYIIKSGKAKFGDFSFQTELDDFEAHLWNVASVNGISEFIDTVDDIYSSNHRAKIQLIQLLYHEFLSIRGQPRRYQLIESMCLSGYKYPPYIYDYISDGKILHNNLEIKIFDNIFLPLIYRFPYHEDFYWGELPTSETYLLAGIRIIQLLHAFQFVRDIPDITYKVPFIFLRDNLNILFQYNESILDLILNEFSEAGIISLVGACLYFPYNRLNYLIEVTHKLHILFSNRWQQHSTDISNNIAYLNMHAMRTQVNINVIHSTCEMPLFKALSLSDDITTKQWVINKILNTISMYRIIYEVDRYEMKQMKKIIENYTLDKETKEIAEYIINDNFTHSLRQSIESQLSKIINKMKDGELKKLKQKLGKYNTYLCSSDSIQKKFAEQSH